VSAPTRIDSTIEAVAPGRAARSVGAAAGPRRQRARVDRFVVLAVLWMGFEWCRPPAPFKVPMLISFALLISWLLMPRKSWSPQVKLMLGFMALVVAGIPFAGNYFSAVMIARIVGVVILCIAIPLSQFIDTIPKLHTVLKWMVAIFSYVALYALTDGGNGPGGRWAGMDENYTSLFMSVSLAMAFFMLFAIRSNMMRILIVAAMAAMMMTTVIGLSRGGFLGMVAVGGYCWFRSPRKLIGVAAVFVAVAGLLIFAPQSYWDEMETIQDPNEGTADIRLEMWKIATWQFADHPLMGVGAGNFPWETYNYETPEQVEKVQRTLGGNVTHSLYFELLAEQGTIGVLIFLALIYYNAQDLRFVAHVTDPSTRVGSRAARRLDRESRRQLALARQHGRMLVGGMLGFFICSAFVSTLYYSAIWILTALVVGLRGGVDKLLLEHQAGGGSEPAAPRPAEPAKIEELDRSASLSGLWAR
jgi:O-antigen ligase